MQPVCLKSRRRRATGICCLFRADDSVAELKLHPQGTLYNARSPAEDPCGGANGRGRGAAYGCGDFAEVSAALVRDRIGEISVVKQIKEIRAEA